MTRIGWGVELQGEPFDLEGWIETLNPPFIPLIPHVEAHLKAPVLRSPLLDATAKSIDIQTEGEYLVDQLNAAFAGHA